MTRDEALSLLREYSEEATIPDAFDWQDQIYDDAMGMPARFPTDGSKAKAMRWLGYMQGVLVALGVYTLDEVKEHSRRRSVAL